MYRLLGLLVATIGAGALGVSVARADTEMNADSGVERPTYQVILAEEAELAAHSSGWVTAVDYGKTPQGRTLRALIIGDPARAGSATLHPTVLISGATHGNEFLHIEDRLPAWFTAHRESSVGLSKFFHGGGVLLIVPVVNPDGFAAGTRENSRGADLNRDFDLLPAHEGHFREVESKLLAHFVDQSLHDLHLKLSLAVDYHCCDGSLLFPWSYSEAPLPPEDLQRFEKIAVMMRQDIDNSYATGATGQVLGYLAHGTSKDYYYAKYRALAFTFEGIYKDEAAKFLKHTLWWEHVLAQLAP